MKKRTKGIIITIVGILVVLLIIVGAYFYALTPVSKDSVIVEYTIKMGTSTKSVINDLGDLGIIRSKIATSIYVKLNKDISIKAGTYKLNKSYSVKEIFEVLTDGVKNENVIKVTFIEGKRITDYIKTIEEKFGYKESEILDVLNDQDYLKELIKEYDFIDESILNKDLYYSLEGYLFPATYEFYKNASIKDIFAKMLAKTQNVLDNYSVSIKESGYTNHEILTMASIIENETMVKEDRSIASQVIYKRLKINMSLGMDVTAYYGVRKPLSETLTTSDLNDNNAYNTRNTSFIGLPVGPISNPSEASIKAALNPSDTDYLYFYADKSGKLHFAKDNNEFQAIIKKYS